MGAQTYPGKGLSLSHLIFALNEELKSTWCSPSYVATVRDSKNDRHADSLCSFTFDEVSRFDKDATTALATIREWRNSLIPANRIPLDILSLIPTHLPSQNDRFRASFVCRHWRRTFLQSAELWSDLFFSRGEVYAKTLLGRAKRCALDVIINRWVPVSTVALLSSHTKQIKSLDVSGWENIQRFSELDSEPLPLLQALTVDINEGDSCYVVSTPPPPPLFNNAVNLKVLRFHSKSWWPPSLTRFVFPNLVLFELSATPSADFSASQLLDFLEASPMLQTVHIKIIARILPGGTPEGRIVILPNVKEFNLIVNDSNRGYWLVTSISCPSASHTTLTQNKDTYDIFPEGFFPDFDQWNAIVRQYTRSPAEEVVLESTAIPIIACTLAFRSPDNTVIELCFRDTIAVDTDDEAIVHSRAFHQAAQKIQHHPQVNIKRLRIRHDSCKVSDEAPDITTAVAQLFQYLGPLDELTIYRCDILPFFYSFLGVYVKEPVVFPRIKEFTIRHPVTPEEECTAAIVGLAKSHHVLGIPLERVIFCAASMPPGMEEAVGPWVGSVEHFCEEWTFGTDGY